MWNSNEKVRIVLDVDEPVEHKTFSLKDPDRVVIDLKGAVLLCNLNNLSLESTPIYNIRWGITESYDLRIVFDLDKALKVKTFTLRPENNYGNRLVIDLIRSKNRIKAIPQTTLSKKEKYTIKTIKSNSNRDIIIAVDAGHGGRDPGAIGYNKIKEKDITLTIARHLIKLFNNAPGFQVKLIRTGDYYISLRDRVKKARDFNADIFVSIHADAFKRTSANGVSIYTLSERGASSETARWLANRENSSDLIGGGDGISLFDKDNILASVLLDLSMTDTQARSINASKIVLSELNKIAPLHRTDVEQAAFVVLKSPDIPSMLIETGFISNPQEARKLTKTSHQKRIAYAIYTGIKKFFYTHTPLGTKIAMQKEKGTLKPYPSKHKVAKGETLSDIAQLYDVPVKDLLKLNGIEKADHIIIDQLLKLH